MYRSNWGLSILEYIFCWVSLPMMFDLLITKTFCFIQISSSVAPLLDFYSPTGRIQFEYCETVEVRNYWYCTYTYWLIQVQWHNEGCGWTNSYISIAGLYRQFRGEKGWRSQYSWPPLPPHYTVKRIKSADWPLEVIVLGIRTRQRSWLLH